MSSPQFVQLDAPAAENVPLAHSGVALEPSHFEPAGHVEHVVRVSLSPPEVNEPDSQVLQDAAPLALYFVSPSHFVHDAAPLPENVPAAHCGLAELPLQRRPAGHTVHVVRWSASPPEVKEPAAHVLHDAAPFPLYLVLSLHLVQPPLPAGAYLPAAQSGLLELPSHLRPAGQIVHVVRVLLSPPEVDEPDLQVLQDAAPLALYFLLLLHFVHEDLPLPENVPALHCGFAELPLQRWPAGQMLQAERVVVAPPDVKDPFEQVLQTPAPWAAKLLSSPHGVLA